MGLYWSDPQIADELGGMYYILIGQNCHVSTFENMGV